VTLINWLLKPKCMLIHIFWNFLWYKKIQYDFFIIIIFERLGRMHENKKYIFLMFWRKPGILIPNLYLYSIKIQTNTKQNEVENCAGKSQIFLKKIFYFFGIFLLGRTRPKRKLGRYQPQNKMVPTFYRAGLMFQPETKMACTVTR
jgi:hypothetical protein